MPLRGQACDGTLEIYIEGVPLRFYHRLLWRLAGEATTVPYIKERLGSFASVAGIRTPALLRTLAALDVVIYQNKLWVVVNPACETLEDMQNVVLRAVGAQGLRYAPAPRGDANVGETG